MKKIITALLIFLMAIASVRWIPNCAAQEKEELSFDLIAPIELTTWIRVCEIFKRAASGIGVQINIKAMETGAWVTAMMETHDFDIAMCGMLMEATPSYLPSLFHSRYAEAGFNAAGVKEDELDDMLDKSLTTTDRDLLKDIIWQIQEDVAENVYSIPFFSEDVVYAYNAKFTGMTGMPGGVTNIWTYLGTHPIGVDYGGELKIGAMGDIKTSNLLMRTLALESNIDATVYDSLVRFAPDLSVVPGLAESWEVSEDGKSWTFYLVENATWHDGVPFTAKDVVFTIETVLENKPPTWYSYFELIDHAEAVDDYTVKIYMKEPYAWMLTTFATFPVIPEHCWKDIPYDTTNPPMIGTGPFKWVRWMRGEYIELERNPNYWKATEPRLDKVLWKVYGTSPAQVLALRGGELDLMYRYIPREAIKTLMEDPNIAVSISPGLNFRYFIPNLRRPPLDDLALRRALAHAVDRDTITNSLFLGYAEPIHSFVPPAWGTWNNPEVPKYKFNTTKANEILDEAGYMDVDGDGVREVPAVVDPIKYALDRITDAEAAIERAEEEGRLFGLDEARSLLTQAEDAYNEKDYATAAELATRSKEAAFAAQASVVLAAQDAITRAEEAIDKAEMEGRTVGLDDAKGKLSDAKALFDGKNYEDGLELAVEARTLADRARAESVIEAYGVAIAGLVIGIVIVVSGYLILRRRK